MSLLSRIKNRKTYMRRKLFLCMLALAVIVLMFLSCGLFFLGHFSTAKNNAVNNLSFQMITFERQTAKYFEDMTRMGNSLSESLAKETDAFLENEDISFKSLNDDAQRIYSLQDNLFDKLGTELLKTDCSGAFLMLNATVNSRVEASEKHKTGLYFQRASLDETDETLLLYRGIAELGRKKNVMPHRQWRLEFDVDEFPDYSKFFQHSDGEIDKKPFLTAISVLNGTSERTMNFVIPIVNARNVVYGLCGFEISANYFKKHFAQSTQLEHLTCMLFPKNGNVFKADNGFSAGVYGGYYFPPKGDLIVGDLGDGLASITGNSTFVAKTRQIKLCGADYVLIAAFPKEEYDSEVANNIVSVVLLLFLLVCTTVVICAFFSKRFLRPLLKGLEQIQKQEHKNAESEFVEIDDLFAFLAEQDRLRDEETEKLRTQCDKQGSLIEQNQTDIDRLAYSRKNEVSPDDYEMFKAGLKTLTKTEKQVFDLYLEDKSTDEIMEICHIQKGTLKYHNHNILNKLGVSSRKQMLRYATLMKQEAQNK